MSNVIVIGSNHHNTLSVLRAFGEYCPVYSNREKNESQNESNKINVSLILVCTAKYPYVKYSKFYSSCNIIDNVHKLPDLLLSTYIMNEKPVIIACSDAIASILDLNFRKLSKYFIVPGSNIQGKLTALMDKGFMTALAKQSGFNVPHSIEISTSDLTEKTIKNLSYPCITKPVVSINGTKSDIFIFHSPLEFINNLKKIDSDKIQIQTYIDKKIEYQLIGCSLNGGETVIIPGASVLIRQPHNTNTGFLKFIPNFKANIESCKLLLKEANFSGLFSMEFLRGKDGIDYFMEINFRNDGNAICMTASGINLPYIWLEHNSGKEISTYIASCEMKEILVMPEFSDIKNVFNGSISIFKWIKDIWKTDCFMEFCKNDQKPFWIYIAQKLKLMKL